MIESECAAVLQWYLLWFLIAIGIGRAAVWEWSVLSKEGNHDNPCHKQNDGEHQQKERDERVNNNFILSPVFSHYSNQSPDKNGVDNVDKASEAIKDSVLQSKVAEHYH